MSKRLVTVRNRRHRPLMLTNVVVTSVLPCPPVPRPVLISTVGFVNGRPTEWNLISEMASARSAAACFSLTKVIEAPAPHLWTRR